MWAQGPGSSAPGRVPFGAVLKVWVCLAGVTVCVLTLAGVQPGCVGDTLLLTRLEKDTAPVAIRIPTALAKVRGGMGEPSHVQGWRHSSFSSSRPRCAPCWVTSTPSRRSRRRPAAARTSRTGGCAAPSWTAG